MTSFIIILLMVSAVASVLVNATGPKAGDPLSYTTGGGRVTTIGAWVGFKSCKPEDLTVLYAACRHCHRTSADWVI